MLVMEEASIIEDDERDSLYTVYKKEWASKLTLLRPKMSVVVNRPFITLASSSNRVFVAILSYENDISFSKRKNPISMRYVWPCAVGSKSENSTIL